MNKLHRMRELIEQLRTANEAYFGKDAPVMSDREYDALMEELVTLEKETGIRFKSSPTGKVGGDVSKELKPVTHTKPMLSCNKTKNMQDIAEFAKGRDVVLSWKMDGLTLVLRYEGGKMLQAITRGSDGLVGEDVTHTVSHFRNIPFLVPCKDRFEVRGEGVVSYEDFKLLAKLGEGASHPRNVAAGAVRSLSADRGKLSHLDFFAFELIREDAPATKRAQLQFLKENNFDVVEHVFVPQSTEKEEMITALEAWTPAAFAYPVDGVVAEYDDIAYGKSLGATAHHEKRMLALKWKDELKETVFRGVELITTRTGAVSIVAKFDEVEIDGTRVHRANLHNLGNFERYAFGEGDIIQVYKANMIIPQIAENLTRSGTYCLPRFCPSCGEELTVRTSPTGVRELYCQNEGCLARNAQKIARYCDRKAMNIDGLSAKVLERMMAYGWIKSFKDLYQLQLHEEEIVNTPTFGADWYQTIRAQIEQSRKCYMYQFLVGLGIPHIGPEAAKILHQYYYGSMQDFEKAIKERFSFSHIAGISLAQECAIYEWYGDLKAQQTLHALMAELNFVGMTKVDENGKNPFRDTEVVLTGTFERFSRPALAELFASLGACVRDFVNESTDYLVYGALPGSKQVGAALKYGVNMISEQKLGELLEQNLYTAIHENFMNKMRKLLYCFIEKHRGACLKVPRFLCFFVNN